ncbi:hypothetical protein CLPU_11c00620 [Gottschalkia purinilytica]|uniref:Uncharacterized protein n=1 Tax=Gottschalkia purinilytica TaxID=1503 RepID=A0A0L0W8J7_GOTPU|nr:hypothetical protein CLPU_11c00620 [Gottschalkia purinilytica]
MNYIVEPIYRLGKKEVEEGLCYKCKQCDFQCVGEVICRY